MDLLKLPPDRFLNAVYEWLRRNRDEKERNRLESQLSLPLPGQAPSTATGVWSDENVMAAFEVALKDG